MKISICSEVVGKPKSKKDHWKMTYSYGNVDLNQDDLASLIDQGYAFCAQHKDKHRKSANFTCSDFIAVDIDSGITLEDALADDFVQSYASIIYTTQSHTEEQHRFRIVFELETAITTPKDMKNAYKGIIKKFGSDPSCNDACRQFFGSLNSKPRVFHNKIPERILKELIVLGEESSIQKDVSETEGGNGKVSVVSNNLLDQDILVKDAEGAMHRLRDLPPQTPIHCPVHLDKKPSAFTLRSRNDVPGVHCVVCSETFFTTASGLPLYDFNYRMENLKKISYDECESSTEDEFFIYSVPKLPHIIWQNERYLFGVNDLDTPIVMVRSPKGTGKTQWLEQVVDRCRKKRQSVLLIGHRRSLIQSVATRLKLTSYIHFEETTTNGEPTERSRMVKPEKYYAICADSLSTLLTPSEHKYDVVIIDEVEQVFSHLTSSTLKDRRNETFQYFKHYVDVAKQVYALDADLNELTVETLYNFISDKKKYFTLIINERNVKDKKLEFYENKYHLLGELTHSIECKKRCFVCSNSKKQLIKVEKALIERFGTSRKILCITSDNSQQSSIQDFIRHIKKRILEYDVILASPSLGTGVDITFPNSEQKIDVVYGFFESRINTHFDIDQQLARVRHPKKVKVWISPETFRFSIDPKIIKMEVKDTERSSRILLRIDPDGTQVYHQNDGYLELYSNVKALQRGSKNDLRYHFRKLKEHEGWEIVDVEIENSTAEGGVALTRRGKKIFEKENAENILDAKLINRSEYKQLYGKKDYIKLIRDELFAMRRYEIESFYYRKIDKDLIKEDRDGKYRSEIRNYDIYTQNESILLQRDKKETYDSIHMTDKKNLLARKDLLHGLFTSAGLANKDHDFITKKKIRGDSLSDFADFCTQHKESIARVFDIDIRKDIHKKPAQQLSKFLRLHGITWKKGKPINTNGTRVYQYYIPQGEIDKLDAILTRRENSDFTKQWRLERSQTVDNRLFEPDDDGDEDDYPNDSLLSLVNL